MRMELFWKFKSYERVELANQFKAYAKMYPASEKILLENLDQRQLPIAKVDGPTTDISIHWSYFKPFPITMVLVVNSEGNIYLRTDLDELADVMTPTPFECGLTIKMGRLDPQTNDFKSHIQRLKNLLRINPFSTVSVLYLDYLRLQSPTSSHVYRFAPLNPDSVGPATIDQVHEMFNDRVPVEVPYPSGSSTATTAAPTQTLMSPVLEQTFQTMATAFHTLCTNQQNNQLALNQQRQRNRRRPSIRDSDLMMMMIDEEENLQKKRDQE